MHAFLHFNKNLGFPPRARISNRSQWAVNTASVLLKPSPPLLGRGRGTESKVTLLQGLEHYIDPVVGGVITLPGESAGTISVNPVSSLYAIRERCERRIYKTRSGKIGRSCGVISDISVVRCHIGRICGNWYRCR